MLSTLLPPEAYALAEKYGLGEPIRVYRTQKKRLFIQYGLVFVFTCLIIFVGLFTQKVTPFAREVVFAIFIAIVALIAIGGLVFLLLLPRTTVYVCASGFLLVNKTRSRSVHWQEVEWVSSNLRTSIVYLVGQRQVELNQFIHDREKLAQEIELKARLSRYPGGNESLEVQLERLLYSQVASTQGKSDYLRSKKKPHRREALYEAFNLLKEYHLGEFGATYRARFKGILRREYIVQPLYYLLLLTFAFLLLEEIFPFIPEQFDVIHLHAHLDVVLFILFIYTYLFMARFSVRLSRLHLYTEGFIYINGKSFEVVRWEQIEKIIYHKTGALVSPPFCHIYLTNGDTITINGYVYDQDEIKRVFNFYVANTVQVG